LNAKFLASINEFQIVNAISFTRIWSGLKKLARLVRNRTQSRCQGLEK
jgi:hypothetical protein